MSRSSRESIYDYIDQSNVSIPSILRCPDLQSEYRSKNRKLIDILTKSQNVHKIIDVLHTTKDFQTARRILGICISPVQIFLNQFAEELEYTEHLLEILAKPKSSHRYVFGIIMQILLKAFDFFPDQMIDIFNSSRKCYTLIVGAIHFPAIFHFSSRLVLRREDMSTFVWVIFAALMDAHGTGPTIPSDVTKDIAHNAVIPRLTPVQRQKAIEVLCIYFNEFGNNSSLYELVSKAVPLMLQDASDDQERALVIRLGLNLEPNEALGYSVLSVVNCFKSLDILLQYSILYIAAFNVMIGNKSIEFFVYRLLKRPANNFVLIACAAMIRHVIEVDPRNSELAKNIQQIIDHAYANNPLMKSNMMLAFRAELAQAAEGNEMDPESNDCWRQLESVQRRKGGKYNQALIDDFSKKDKQIMESNDVFRPQFNVKQLWKSPETYAAMSSFFKTVTRLPHLEQSVTISRPLPPPSPKRTPKKQQISLSPKTKNLNDLRRTHSDDEVDIDDADDDDGPHTFDPTLPKLNLTNTYTRQPYNSIIIASDDDEEEEVFEEEEDDDFADLPEIDVQESYELFQSRQQEAAGPLTDTETLSEPLPTEALEKGQKPIPKLNPESPRSNKQMFLSQDRLFTDDKKVSERPTPILIPNSPQQYFEEEEDYDYVYEYEDEEQEGAPAAPQPKLLLQPQPQLQQQIKPQLQLAESGKISSSQPTFISQPQQLAEPTTPPKMPGTPPATFTTPTRKEPELESLDYLLEPDDYEEIKISSPKRKVASPRRSPRQQEPAQSEQKQEKEIPPPAPVIDRKYFRLQLDLEAVDSKPVQKPKAVMHRRVLVIEIPEKKPPLLFIAPTLSVERPEVPQQPKQQSPRQERKLAISETPRCFYSYDDSNEEEEEKDTLSNEPFVEEIITL